MYIVIEVQTNEEGKASTIVTSYDNPAQAESKYHTILAAAAVSTVPKHGAVILQDDCTPVMWYSYDHKVTE